MGNLDIVRNRYDDDRLGDIEAAHDRMATLIDDLRTLARQGEVVTDPEAISLANAVEAAWTGVSTDQPTLEVETEQTIQADIGRVQQLLENLLRNAVTHGGEDVTITVGELPDGFYVEDDGPGIPPDQRGRVFETGYTTGDGTGFGLSIVARIAEAHDWEATITDGTEGGARIEFRGVTVADA
jgi:signal transduction histidine kinase